MSESCETYQSLIFRLPDGDLTAAEKAALKEHLRACPDCRRVYRAFADVASVLRDDLVEAPASLADGVMDRVYAAETARTPARTAQTTPRRRWRGIAVAACLAAVVGGGAYLGANLFGPKGAAGASAPEAILMEAAAEEPAPLPEEAPAAGDGVRWDFGVPTEGAAEEAVEEEAAEAQTSLNAAMEAPAENAARDVYSWEHPALVPEGREAAFEALIQAAGRAETDVHLVAAVEYNGVIYEFLTDDGGTALYWQDAAESIEPLRSPGSVDDLWAVIDG